MKVLPFPVKIYIFEIFTRATPGSSLVFNIFVFGGCPFLEKPPPPLSFSSTILSPAWSGLALYTALWVVSQIYSSAVNRWLRRFETFQHFLQMAQMVTNLLAIW